MIDLEAFLRGALRTVAVAGLLRALLTLAAAALAPSILLTENASGIPVLAPTAVALALALAAYLLIGQRHILFLAFAAIWSSASWGFGTAVLREARWPRGEWYWLLIPGLAVAAPVVIREIWRGYQVLAAAVVAVVAAGLIGSASPEWAVIVAATVVYGSVISVALLTVLAAEPPRRSP